MEEPKLRTADKIKPPYPLGLFPKDTVMRVAGSIIYQLYTRGEARLEGPDWEQIFADAIQAEWKPSNIGLDDVQLGNCCWSAKTVKNKHPANAQRIRLITGRNSLDYSYKQSDSRGLTPAEIGKRVLGIWNGRASSIRQRFAHCRTVVLMKSDDLSECALFEFETLRFEPERFIWKWNGRGNLEGRDENGLHKFTWQPHGAQFTVVEDVPTNRLAFKLRMPEKQARDITLKAIGFDDSWVTIL
jgi:hypothetical protein